MPPTPLHPRPVPGPGGWPTYEGRPLADPAEPVVDQGLGFDLATDLDRRRLLRGLAASVGAVLLAGCAGAVEVAAGGTTAAGGGTSTPATAAAGAVCSTPIPEETAGPYPGDGTNGPDVLSQSGVVRRDLTTSFGGLSGSADGVPLQVTLFIEDSDAGCTPYAGAAVYLWHCDAAGRYSLYSEGVTDQNWLRGVQQADADGRVVFDTIYPGCYDGRWPHIHFEVYPDLDAATDAANRIATSQIALPEAASAAVYADGRYAGSAANAARVTLGSDGVFGDDGGVSQLGEVTGSVAAGYAVHLDVPVSAATQPTTAGGPAGGPGGGGPPPGR